MRFLPFEDQDPSLMPLAARRALDRAGLKLSLRAWQGVSLVVRETLASLGEGADVDAIRVAELVADADPAPTAIEAWGEPDVAPQELAALGRPIDRETWQRLTPLARYALASYARRGRTEKLLAAYESLLGTS